VADSTRIEELRRRVQKDPASIAFAQLAEEYRRAGRLRDAVDTCEAGLGRHPGYLSARVTLGRALLELGDLDAAQAELKQVLQAAPENLAALRGLADIHHRRGELREALAHYRTALEFAPHDPELERLVDEIGRQLEPAGHVPPVVDGLSFEDVQRELLSLSMEPAGDDAVAPSFEPGAEPVTPEDVAPPDGLPVSDPAPDPPFVPEALEPEPPPAALPPEPVAPAAAADAGRAAPAAVDALEQWLEAIVADRERRAAPPAGPDGH
jgi:tetratricopeptide (TPR) repeat protein